MKLTVETGVWVGGLSFFEGTKFGSVRRWAAFPCMPLPAHLGQVPLVLFLLSSTTYLFPHQSSPWKSMSPE